MGSNWFLMESKHINIYKKLSFIIWRNSFSWDLMGVIWHLKPMHRSAHVYKNMKIYKEKISMGKTNQQKNNTENEDNTKRRDKNKKAGSRDCIQKINKPTRPRDRSILVSWRDPSERKELDFAKSINTSIEHSYISRGNKPWSR